MPYKITHRSRAQEIRFPTQAAAERYADQVAGGLSQWTVSETGQTVQQPGEEQQAG
ncbi:hypothetical protein [Amycolatopsis sp.]|uniref:hypothetical protein n=1 Tax=Amycolatopsis sp. TaxID=37632 RepID=UPI002B9921B3|nr:hypothetical protein [Amycolatopsis sp.]HVV11492.1 hypothetical protein [Amycolatopsis sp.]